MLLQVLFLSLALFHASDAGTFVSSNPINPTDLLGTLNSERTFWKIPILEWDDGLAQLAAHLCRQCNPDPNKVSAAERSNFVAAIKGFEYTTARWATIGETRSFTGTGNGAPGAGIWLSAYAPHDSTADWQCTSNSCKSGANPAACQAYTQVVWYRTSYVGCAACSCKGDQPSGMRDEWDQLICSYNEAGNFNNEHPFTTNRTVVAEICLGTYQIPHPEPQPVCGTCTDVVACPMPVSDAVCENGAWTINRAASLSEFSRIQCPTLLKGDLTGTASDAFNVTACGHLEVTGSVSFTGAPFFEVDFQSLSPVSPGDTFAVLNFTGGQALFQAPYLVNVFTPTVDLSGMVLTSASSADIFLFQTNDGNPVIPTLTDGSTSIGNSPRSEATPPVLPGNTETLNDPNRPFFVNPGAPIPPGVPIPVGSPVPPGTPTPPPAPVPTGPPTNSSEASSKGLPGWAIFLIVLAVLIAIALLIGIIVVLFTSSQAEERM